jgi:hypothetical protein
MTFADRLEELLQESKTSECAFREAKSLLWANADAILELVRAADACCVSAGKPAKVAALGAALAKLNGEQT